MSTATATGVKYGRAAIRNGASERWRGGKERLHCGERRGATFGMEEGETLKLNAGDEKILALHSVPLRLNVPFSV